MTKYAHDCDKLARKRVIRKLETIVSKFVALLDTEEENLDIKDRDHLRQIKDDLIEMKSTYA